MVASMVAADRPTGRDVDGGAPAAGPFPLPVSEQPIQDSRLVAPTEVVVVWRTVSQAVEEFAVRIDTVSRDQLVFGGLARNSQMPVENARLERRLFHTMVLPNESMLSIRTRAGSPHPQRARLAAGTAGRGVIKLRAETRSAAALMRVRPGRPGPLLTTTTSRSTTRARNAPSRRQISVRIVSPGNTGDEKRKSICFRPVGA